jgi:site-specific DNA-methyltransferase (adenine-specific)/adenine-specific DNA-methyltransferase
MPTLNWIGKEAVVNHHRQVPYHLLRCDEKLSVGNPGSGNLLVQGDNLLALKALLPYYAGQVKCIFIDPPYNTGNENWVYNDAVSSPEIEKWLGQVVGKEAEDLSRHDKWLCMMHPRLALLRDFLRDDGSIFITIDDNEVQNLRAIMDELFGPRNFVANAIWQKRTSPDMRLSFSTAHDYVLVYARNIERVAFNKIPKTAKQAAQFRNPDNDPRGPWVSSDYTAQGYRPNQMYTIRTPGGAEYKPPPGVCWKNVESVFLDLVRDGRIWFGKDGKGMPRRKTFLSESEGNAVWTWWPNEDVGHTQEAKKELDAILGEGHGFETPKPTRLLQRVLAIATDKHSLILDSFAGSGTTGHAVLAANKADGGNRRFILVEMEPDICQNVTTQRLARAVQGYEPANGNGGKKVDGLGGGFRYCKLADPVFDASGRIHAEVRFADLAAHVFFTETGEPIPKRTNGRTPLIGVCNGTAYYLLFNGVLGDKSVDGGNVLTGKTLADLPAHDGPKVVYGEGCRLGPARLKREGITFKQVPYEIKVS